MLRGAWPFPVCKGTCGEKEAPGESQQPPPQELGRAGGSWCEGPSHCPPRRPPRPPAPTFRSDVWGLLASPLLMLPCPKLLVEGVEVGLPEPGQLLIIFHSIPPAGQGKAGAEVSRQLPAPSPDPSLHFGGFRAMPDLVHSPRGSVRVRPTHHSLHPQLVPKQLSPSTRPPGGPLSRSDDITHSQYSQAGAEGGLDLQDSLPAQGLLVPGASLSSSPAPPSLSTERAPCPHDTSPRPPRARTQFLTPGPQTATPSPSDHPKPQP